MRPGALDCGAGGEVSTSTDYRGLAVEHSSDDIFELAERSACYRQAFLVCLAQLADRERRLERSRECFARLRDENRRLRASVMQTDIARAA